MNNYPLCIGNVLNEKMWLMTVRQADIIQL